MLRAASSRNALTMTWASSKYHLALKVLKLVTPPANLRAMFGLLISLLQSIKFCFRNHTQMEIEIFALRHQLNVLQRSGPATAAGLAGPLVLDLPFTLLDQLALRSCHREA